MRFHLRAILLFLISLPRVVPSLIQSPDGSCGPPPQGPLCSEGYCCSISNFCGSTPAYCDPPNCQSQCPSDPPPPPPVGPTPPPPVGPTPPSPSGGNLTSVIPRETFEYMLRYRNDPRCHAVGFYTYDAFITAAQSFPEFGNTGDLETRKREIAAFFGQTSHETTGGWPEAPEGPYAWGYCYLIEIAQPILCDPDRIEWPCSPGKRYYGRGPIQLSWNYNYGPCGVALDMPLLQYPELVEEDPITAFKAALWFWMTPQPPKPSSHDVIVGQWVPTDCDKSANRLPGYGVITNIINGGLECKGRGPAQVADRIGFYTTYCDLFGISYGDNVDCADQTPFNEGCASIASI